jgi:hypothetical protein
MNPRGKTGNFGNGAFAQPVEDTQLLKFKKFLAIKKTAASIAMFCLETKFGLRETI